MYGSKQRRLKTEILLRVETGKPMPFECGKVITTVNDCITRRHEFSYLVLKDCRRYYKQTLIFSNGLLYKTRTYLSEYNSPLDTQRNSRNLSNSVYGF